MVLSNAELHDIPLYDNGSQPSTYCYDEISISQQTSLNKVVETGLNFARLLNVQNIPDVSK